MKIKKILVILTVILIIFIAVVAIFLLTFDVNRYRGFAEERISKAIGRDIKLGRISINFLHGLGCRVDGVSLKEKTARWDDAWLNAESVDISLKILPLLKKDIQIDMLAVRGMVLRWSDKPGVKDVSLEARLTHGDVFIERFSGKVAGGTFSVRGKIKDISSKQLAKLNISCSGIELDRIVPKTEPGSPRFQGLLGIGADVEFQGLQQEGLINSLSGSGTARISGPALKNMNILRVALSKIDIIPGLIAKLKENLPQKYIDALNQNETQFKPINASYTISQGNIAFKELLVESDGFIVRSAGSVGLLGDVRFSSQLFILPDLSKAFVGIVRELKYLQNQEGMINMPLSITGRAPQVLVDIDKQYVLNKLIVSKGTELIGNLLSGKKKSSQDTQEEQAPQPQNAAPDNSQQGNENAPDPASIFKSILDGISSQK